MILYSIKVSGLNGQWVMTINYKSYDLYILPLYLSFHQMLDQAGTNKLLLWAIDDDIREIISCRFFLNPIDVEALTGCTLIPLGRKITRQLAGLQTRRTAETARRDNSPGYLSVYILDIFGWNDAWKHNYGHI